MNDSSGESQFEYDQLNRIQEEIRKVKDLGKEYSVKYQYNKAGQVKEMIDAKGESVNYSYDIAGRLQDVQSSEVSSTYNYDGVGNILKRIDNNGITEEFDYTALNQVKELKIRKNSTVKFHKQYQYDLNGNRETEIDMVKGKTHKFYFDNLDRLTGADYEYNAGSPALDLIYEYDKVGNRTRNKNQFNDYKYYYKDDSNELDYYINGNERMDFEHDDNGNMTRQVKKIAGVIKQEKIFQYDFENQLTSIEERKPLVNDPAELAQVKMSKYKYDGFGRRMKKDVNNLITEKQKTKYYLYSGMRVINEIGQDGKIDTGFVYGHTKIAQKSYKREEVNGVEVEKKSLGYIYQDPLGSAVIMADKKGNIVQQEEYAPFGELLYSVYRNNKTKNNYKFTGKELDEESGMHYFGARYYDPKLGRFITKDPIRDGINHFVYAENKRIS